VANHDRSKFVDQFVGQAVPDESPLWHRCAARPRSAKPNLRCGAVTLRHDLSVSSDLSSLTIRARLPKLVPLMPTRWTILATLAGWIAFIAVYRLAVLPWFRRGPQGDPVVGLIWRFVRLYCRAVHHVEFAGEEKLRNMMDPGPLIVVSNHTGAVDPLLIQSGCRFQIRWIMASEMMIPTLDWLWRKQEVIPVDRDGKDAGPAREAIRQVQGGGVVGIFPEGRIVQPPRQIRPFYTGVGLIVARAHARVLLVWVSGTPDTNDLHKSIFTPSHARVRYVELMDFKGERDAHVITDKLRNRLAKVTGWPLNDEPQPPNEDEE
jgi:1-acyl-sn-glycerol-3-phosphate acyltransferase